MVAVGTDEVRVFRCSWGWCVKRDGVPYRARTLLEAFEEAFGRRLDAPLLARVVGLLERALDAQHARENRTVSTVVDFAQPDVTLHALRA
jgi:hypothetical protein